METLGMNLTEGKALLAGVQDFVVSQQAREESELLASAVGRAFSTSQNRQSRAGCALGMSFGHSGLSEPRDLGRSRRQYDREKRRDGRLDGESHRSGPDRHLAEICRRSGATEYGYPYF
jgi:hypothetical protein